MLCFAHKGMSLSCLGERVCARFTTFLGESFALMGLSGQALACMPSNAD